MKLSYFPQIKVIHTSRIFHGQLFIPIANWLLMIGTILIASIYNNVRSGLFLSLFHSFLTTYPMSSRRRPWVMRTAYVLCL
jgi:hypothetical protein